MTFPWQAADGEVFSGEQWTPPSSLRGRLICIHGLGGAATDFTSLGEATAARGFSAFAPNLRGQGCDPEEKRRGRFLEPNVLARDLTDFVTALPASTAPVVLCGESLGALLVAWALSQRPFPFPLAGVILSVPVVDLKKPTPALGRALIRALARIVPTLPLNATRFVTPRSEAPWEDNLTRDQAHVEYLRSAPHRIRRFSVSTLNALGNLMDARATLAAGLQVPTLVLAAGEDIYIAPTQVKAWFDQIAAEDKTFRLYPEARHLLWNDFDREQVIADILSWMEARCPRRANL